MSAAFAPCKSIHWSRVSTRQVRLEKWVAGKLVASEEYALRGNTYLKPELLLMLKVAGFREITVMAITPVNRRAPTIES